MNRIEYDHLGGFPLDTSVLNEVQNSYDIFNKLGDLAGDLAIISGCEKLGNTITDGVVYIAGEVLAFKGGALGTNVTIKQDIENRIFENGESKPVLFKRYVTFGTGTVSYKWEEFFRIMNNKAIQSEITRISTKEENKLIVFLVIDEDMSNNRPHISFFREISKYGLTKDDVYISILPDNLSTIIEIKYIHTTLSNGEAFFSCNQTGSVIALRSAKGLNPYSIKSGLIDNYGFSIPVVLTPLAGYYNIGLSGQLILSFDIIQGNI